MIVLFDEIHIARAVTPNTPTARRILGGFEQVSKLSFGRHPPEIGNPALCGRVVANIGTVNIVLIIDREFMHMSAACTRPKNRELAVRVKLPNRFQVTEVNVAHTIDDDARWQDALA